MHLYDRRLKAFRDVMRFIAQANQHVTVTLEEQRKLLQDTYEIEFLFGPDAAAFVDTLYKNAVHIEYLNKKLVALRSQDAQGERHRLAEEEGELLKWFGGQYEEGKRILGKHLALHEN